MATLTAFDPKSGAGRVKIDELLREKGRFYVTVKYGQDGQTRIDYKIYDVHKSIEYSFFANRNEAVTGIEIVRVVAD
uniref:Uncharacterized protein n=1 Tax=mine drainage metagenome TaxID=410659 RepID=E6PX39_9ZZZZ